MSIATDKAPLAGATVIWKRVRVTRISQEFEGEGQRLSIFDWTTLEWPRRSV